MRWGMSKGVIEDPAEIQHILVWEGQPQQTRLREGRLPPSLHTPP